MRTIAFLLSIVIIFMIPWENAITVGEFGTLSRVIGGFTATIWLASALAARGFRKPHPFHMIAVLFILWNIVSIFWSAGVDETIQRIKTYVQLAMLAWILWDLYMTPKALILALQAYVLGAYVSIGSIVFNYLAGQEFTAYAVVRYSGADLNANALALILALGLPVAWYLATSASSGIKNDVLRIVNFVYIPASLFATILTGTRAVLFAIVPAFLYIVGTANRLKPTFRILIIVAIVGSLFSLQTFIPQSTLKRFATIDDSIRDRDLSGRVKLWRASIMLFSKHPLCGVGSGALRTFPEMGSAAHNVFISVLAELGLIGFSLFVVMLTIVAYQAVNQPKWISNLMFTVLLIWVIGVLTTNWEARKPTWLFLSLVVISANLSIQNYQFTLHSKLSASGKPASQG